MNEALETEQAKEKRLIKEKLASIKHILLVLSGKGGVGKSTVAVNIATEIAQTGKRVGLLDEEHMLYSLEIVKYELIGKRPCGAELQDSDLFVEPECPDRLQRVQPAGAACDDDQLGSGRADIFVKFGFLENRACLL